MMSIRPCATAVIITVNVAVWTWNVGFEVAIVAFPVIVTVKVAVVVAVPLKVSKTPIFLAPGLVPPRHGAVAPKHGAVLLNATFKVPVPEFRTDEALRLIVPVNPAALTAELVADGRLPRAIVPVAEFPVWKLAGFPPVTVML